MTDTYLLIGGSRDGERMSITGSPREIHAPARVDWAFPVTAYVSDDVYHLAELRDAEGVHRVYAHTSLGDGNIIRHLLDGYRNNKNKRERQ